MVNAHMPGKQATIQVRKGNGLEDTVSESLDTSQGAGSARSAADESDADSANDSANVSREAMHRNHTQDDAVLSLDEYVARFSHRYTTEKVFRIIVHNYLDLGGFQRLGISFAKTFLRSRYRKKTAAVVSAYAQKIREDLLSVQKMKQEMYTLEEVATDLDNAARDVQTTTQQHNAANEEDKTATQKRDSAVQEIERQAADLRARENARAAAEQQEIERRTDAAMIVKEKLQENLKNSSLVQVDEDGRLQFDEQRICEKLEEIVLSDVIQDIEREDGRSGFVTTLKAAYNGVVDYYDVLEDLDELAEVEWIQSTILSRTRGYRIPVFPYLITGKPEKKEKGKASIDTAIALDTSESMNENNRFAIGQKTCMALKALMRRLNPQNETFLAHYNGQVYPVTTAELLRSVHPYNGTRTELALDWLIQTLSGRGMSMAYLISDGDPNNLNATVEAAKTFQHHPYILLRIFLIDGNKETEENIRKIGKAAGPLTKVVSVKNYQLSGGVIRDVAAAMGDMHSIGEF